MTPEIVQDASFKKAEAIVAVYSHTHYPFIFSSIPYVQLFHTAGKNLMLIMSGNIFCFRYKWRFQSELCIKPIGNKVLLLRYQTFDLY